MGEDVPDEVVRSLEATARALRREILLEARASGAERPARPLAAADLLTALLFHELPERPPTLPFPRVDRLVFAHGEAGPALRAALRLRCTSAGGEPRVALEGTGGNEGDGPGADPRLIDTSPTGRAHGMGIAVGLAVDARIARRPGPVYALLGERECAAGGTWEALLVAGEHRLHNLVAVLDLDRPEGDPSPDPHATPGAIEGRLRSFGYETIGVDGHDLREILRGLERCRGAGTGPHALVAHTVRGRGVSFMEDPHASQSRPPSDEEYERALVELSGPAGGPPA
ncbi:MAG: hypothetical protein L3K10_02720 [Thermoplasmata archaeon]|nr:hypothetical protein [Thermoplasmata archaeon]